MTESPDIEIRKAKTYEEYRACQEAQRRAWGIVEEGYVVPVATMAGAQEHGGLVLGAFRRRGDGVEAVGLSFAFLGRVRGRLCLYSQLTGVVPEYQDRGLGRQLKQRQREWARSQGLELIAWAIDPFQTGNANFNLAILGVVGVNYVEDMYGPRTDALNRGVPTDRLIVVWETEVRPRPPIPAEVAVQTPRIIETEPRSPARLSVAGVALDLTARWLALEIPAELFALRREDPDLAQTWRQAVRAAFHSYFAKGYQASGFARVSEGDTRRCFYLLERETR